MTRIGWPFLNHSSNCGTFLISRNRCGFSLCKHFLLLPLALECIAGRSMLLVLECSNDSESTDPGVRA